MMAGKPNNNRSGGDKAFAAWFEDKAEAAGFAVGRHGWKADLVRATGLSFSSISRFANGLAVPPPEACQALADAFGIPLDEAMVKAGHITPAEAKARQAGATVRQMTPTARRVDTFLSQLPPEDPQRKRIERAMNDLLDALEQSGSANGTAS